MRIIVNNKKEEELVERFLTLAHDYNLIDELEDIDKECCEQSMLEGDTIFLESAICDALVMVEPDVPPICIDSDSVDGVCVTCGALTNGTFNGEEMSYEDYLDMKSSDSNWQCEECYNKRDDT